MRRRETPRITGGQDFVRDKNSMSLSKPTLALMWVLGLALCSNVQAWGQAGNVRNDAHIAAVALGLVGMKCVISNPTRTKGLP